MKPLGTRSTTTAHPSSRIGNNSGTWPRAFGSTTQSKADNHMTTATPPIPFRYLPEGTWMKCPLPQTGISLWFALRWLSEELQEALKATQAQARARTEPFVYPAMLSCERKCRLSEIDQSPVPTYAFMIVLRTAKQQERAADVLFDEVMTREMLKREFPTRYPSQFNVYAVWSGLVKKDEVGNEAAIMRAYFEIMHRVLNGGVAGAFEVSNLIADAIENNL